MKEKLLLKFKLPSIENLTTIEAICVLGYRETGEKFQVIFNGSKGYLDSFEISCEGNQEAENRICFGDLRNKDRSLKSILVNIFYSEEFGIRLSTGADEPRSIVKSGAMDENDDLPF